MGDTMKMRWMIPCLLASFMILIAARSARSQQQIVLNFVGRNAATGTVQTLDSIQVTCLTRSFDTTLIGVQQLVLHPTTGVDNHDTPLPERIALSGNFGNPFTDRTSFDVSLTGRTGLTLQVFNILGKKITGMTMQAEPGVHRFRFEGNALDPGVYFLTALVGSYQSTTKMLKIDGGGNASPQLVYEGLVSAKSGGSIGFMKVKDVGG
jgi:hypothetical protein